MSPFSPDLRMAEIQDLIAALAPVPAVLLANLAVRERWAWFANLLIAGGAVLGVGVLGVMTMVASRGNLAPGLILVLSALIAAPALSGRARELASGVLPFDPRSPVAMLALVAVVLLVGLQLHYQTGNDALAAVSRLPQVRPVDILIQEIPLLLIALLGVGLLTRRPVAGVLQRLGIVRPAWWQLTLALAAAGLFLGVSQGAEHLQELVNPEQARRLNQATAHYYGGITGVTAIAAIALAPGIAEECLFRGALQPRLGILLAALAFAAVHSQYGLTVDTLLVFTLGSGLGLIRRYLNTTTAIATHASYNAMASLGLAGTGVLYGLAVEGCLVALTLALFWFARRGLTAGDRPYDRVDRQP